MDKKSKIFVAGHTGLVGSAITRELEAQGYTNLILKQHKELDLMDRLAVSDFFQKEKPEFVFLAAAKVGGIMANQTYPADFIYQNLMIESNVIHESYRSKVKKLLFLGSSCIYPKLASQPIKEESLLTGLLEETNKPYAIAKIAGIVMCESYNRQYGTNFISAMPTNIYGTHDNFDPETAHVIPALIKKFHDAKQAGIKSVTLWGTGTPRREFLFVDDLASACVFLMDVYDGKEAINIGTGEDIRIEELAELIKKEVGFKGDIKWDESIPDGTPQKILDVSRIHTLGWKHKISPEEGIKKTYVWYLKNMK
ncbi:MAG: GDP-L-fucose synthase [Candidatus Pacebacteria bacterium]|nr:GDP-L-fucose synthase [Candidatus Paceibacterota bacterium]